MTAHRLWSLSCDGCGEINDWGAQTARSARESAAAEGWIFMRGPGGVPRDLCRVCAHNQQIGGRA